MEIVGYISQSVIETLGLKLEPGTPVFIGESNIAHIKNRLDSLCEAIQGKCGLCPCGR